MAAIPPTMRAWVGMRRGPVRSSLELIPDFPTPAVPAESSSDVLIRVSHVALQVNSELFFKALPKLSLTGPFIPELELSGEVVAAGENAPAEVRDPGTHVVAFEVAPLKVILGRGMLADYVRLPSSQVVRIDPAVDMASASGLSCSGCAALKMIRTVGVREGHTVLVNGASGSVGSLLVQLCKLRGAKVVGVASGGNEAMVRGMGVDEVGERPAWYLAAGLTPAQFVDYRQHDPLPAFLANQYGDKPFDFILDCVGTQALFVHSPGYLKADGALVNIGMLENMLATTFHILLNTLLPTWLGGVPRRYMMVSSPPLRDDVVYLAHLVEEGHLRIPVDSVFAMEDALLGYDRIATKRSKGKVVVNVRGD
ncbi:NAD(P)-dependent alcohol dehydrogenase [Aspergillus affinis]|uniref:NAD(P)-dependent alcohol dehydrogenase n=1 Tax=Aspergillus affinis TaxID=1070780 RepID=UPI0022FED0F3|nr:NAD(P)-binding protein [Aspergillus affinis]KAI9037664.1 NAD(P)-binding protein [Aspergillus affinis]